VAVFESSVELPCTPAALFEFFTQPENLIKVSPPELQVQLVESPARLELGSLVTILGRRWGISQRMTTEVVGFDPCRLLADEQRAGPFRSFRHTRLIDSAGLQARLTEKIEFEPPGGIVGLFMTASRIRDSLAEVSEFRNRAMREIFQALMER
jgi:ligand-binding SRPBCC domain-containing protein